MLEVYVLGQMHTHLQKYTKDFHDEITSEMGWPPQTICLLKLKEKNYCRPYGGIKSGQCPSFSNQHF